MSDARAQVALETDRQAYVSLRIAWLRKQRELISTEIEELLLEWRALV